MATTYQYALKRPRKVNGQVGGVNPAAVIQILDTVNQVGQKIKPATKIGSFLESHVSEKGKKKLSYKIANAITDFGKSIGWGGAEMIIIKKKTKKRKSKK